MFAELLAEQLLDPCVHRFDLRCDTRGEGAAARGQRDAHPALIVGEARAGDETDLLHSRQHPGEAGTRQAAQFPDLARLQRSRIEQHTHDPPLLLGDPMSVENGPETADDMFSGLQHEERQVAVLQSDCF